MEAEENIDAKSPEGRRKGKLKLPAPKERGQSVKEAVLLCPDRKKKKRAGGY